MREDWIDVELKDVCLSSKGKKPSVLEKNNSETANVPYINIKAFEKGIIEEYTDGEKCNLCEDGDLLMVWDGARAGLTGKAKKGAVGSTLMRIEEVKGIEKEYLYYFLLSLFTKINTNPRGVGIPHVEPRILWLSKVLIVSSPIQRAIVSKIEALFSDLDNGIANLKKAQEQLKIYRQAVLKKAFEGELTKEWREKIVQTPNLGVSTPLPTAEELLKQIKEERQNHYNQQIEDWKKAVKEWEKNGKVGKKPSKPKQQKELPPLNEEELNELPKLPKSMVWTQLGNVVWSVKDGPHFSPKYSKTGIPFISGGNIRPEKIDFEKVKYISEELHKELSRRCKPQLDDILYTKGGTTGIAKVNTYKFDFNVWVHVAVLRPIQMILPLYLQHVLNSSHCYKQSQEYTHGVGNQDLGLTRMILITLPICCKEEQTQIVQEIESRLSVCDKVEQSITESLEKAEALRQSILKKAFEGKLLSEAEIEQCKKAADYEPAAKLLERIKQEKINKDNNKKTKSK
ncbi:MAG: restriction endonuclease subunit S [Calditrichaceae bacterium]